MSVGETLFALVQLLLLMSNSDALTKEHIRSFDECNLGEAGVQTGDRRKEDRIDYVSPYRTLAYDHWSCTIPEQVNVKGNSVKYCA